MESKACNQEGIANKRVALTPSTWSALSDIKKPGKTLGETVADLISEHQRATLERDLDEVDASATYVPWDDAKAELGL